MRIETASQSPSARGTMTGRGIGETGAPGPIACRIWRYAGRARKAVFSLAQATAARQTPVAEGWHAAGSARTVDARRVGVWRRSPRLATVCTQSHPLSWRPCSNRPLAREPGCISTRRRTLLSLHRRKRQPGASSRPVCFKGTPEGSRRRSGPSGQTGRQAIPGGAPAS